MRPSSLFAIFPRLWVTRLHEQVNRNEQSSARWRAGDSRIPRAASLRVWEMSAAVVTVSTVCTCRGSGMKLLCPPQVLCAVPLTLVPTLAPWCPAEEHPAAGGQPGMPSCLCVREPARCAQTRGMQSPCPGDRSFVTKVCCPCGL